MEHTYSDMKQKNLVLQRIKEVFENPVQVGIFDTDDERVSVETVKCLTAHLKELPLIQHWAFTDVLIC